MLEPKSVVESIADLRRLGSSFRSLIAYAGDDAVKHWHRLRAMGDTILNDIWLETRSSPRSAFDAIEGFRNQDLSAWPRSSCDHNRFFKKLVGFEFEPRYRSFMAPWPFFFEDGSHLTRELCFSSGLVFQPVIPVDPELADDLERLWPLHRFELLDRCANGCEMIIEIIEREMAADNQADEDDADDGVLLDGLYRADALFVWNGKRYEWLTETMMDVLELLCKCYPEPVKPSAIEHKIGSIPEGGFKKVFRVNRKDQKGLHEVVSIISGRASKGWYLIK
jgi:hypothetical protein